MDDINIPPAQDWWRYLAQDADGLWCVYKSPPRRSSLAPMWTNEEPPSKALNSLYEELCITELNPNHNTLIIDLKEKYGFP